ncbi:MAG: polysaccharide deacetylase family protein [Victivallales bacterium]|nr:polysaccharide deacetylase family protein [Victivallales bacterium]
MSSILATALMLTLEILPLWPDGKFPESTLTRHVRQDAIPRPAILVVPGGGYGGVCTNTEGDPIAERFASLGFQVFTLHYRVAPNRFPAPQQDILRAIKMMRAHSEDWHLLKDNIAVVGFSAGGHLCASASVFESEVDASAGDAADQESGRPDACILCYPVITFKEFGHRGSGENLLGDDFEANRERFSLETRVTPQTPPAFLWHTAADQLVPYQNSTLYAEALRKNGVLCEEHIMPLGQHGTQLGYGNEDLERWPEQARRFLSAVCKFRFPRRRDSKRTVILTFDDACKSHLEYVAPLLLKYGFGATFFVTRFGNNFPEEKSKHLLTGDDIYRLHKMGFEIGSHSWEHADYRRLTPEQIEKNIVTLNRLLIGYGIPLPYSFAYPGGPYGGDAAASILTLHNIKYARTTENRLWQPDTDEWKRIPIFSLNADTVKDVVPGKPAIVLFHGVPDIVHPHVSCPPERFEAFLKLLKDNDFEVCSLRDYDEI